MSQDERSLVLPDGGADEFEDDPNLTVLEPEESSPLGWYRCIDPESTSLALGAVVWVYERKVWTEKDGIHVHYRRGESGWHAPEAWFEAHFEPDPQGALHRQQEIAALMQEMEGYAARATTLDRALGRGDDAYITDAGDLAGTALAQANTAEGAKRAVASVRNTAAKMRQRMLATQGVLTGMLAEQERRMRELMGELEEKVALATKAIWTINLYLGTNETIVQLREGEPAPLSTPITIRQRVLFMDEESAIAAEQGGITFEEMDEFDAWLLADPRNLAQVLPELKGIVALKPRRKMKDRRGEDAWSAAEKAKEDQRTYFLVRNGQQVFRFWTSYDAHERLIPREDEFLPYFRSRYSSEPIKPGSREWMDAQKAASEAQLYFRQFFLLLQGLLDRTTVFAPLPGPINLGDRNTWGSIFSIVRDDDKALTEGRERFKDWLKRINSKLDVGMRVVGAWDNWEHGLRLYRSEGRRGNDRLSPGGASLPPQDQIFTLEGRRDGGLFFRYKRTDSNWHRYYSGDGSEEYQTRASCVVYPYDNFILNIDSPDVRVADMRYYLTSRLDREEYAYMFGVLRTAIAALEAEAHEEEPFCQLLASQLLRVQGSVDPDAAEDLDAAMDAVPELVRWYKTANRYHRALLADDAKALRLIVDEYRRRLRLARGGLHLTQADSLLKQYPDALMVAHKPSSDLVVLVPENSEPIFVREITVSQGGVVRADRRWRTVDARWQSWQVFHCSDRWEGWQRNASPWENLTDPERLKLAEDGWTRELASYQRARERRPKEVAELPLFLAATAEGGSVAVYYRAEMRRPPLGPLGQIPALDVGFIEFGWKRNAKREVELRDGATRHNVSWSPNRWPWEPDSDFGRYHQNQVVLKLDAVNMAKVKAEHEAFLALRRRQAKLMERITAYQSAVDVVWKKQQEDAAFAKFLADYGDLELWEGHRKALNIPDRIPHWHGLRKLIEALVMAEVDPAGLTLAQAKVRYDEVVAAARAQDDAPEHWWSVRGGYSDYRDYDPTPPEDVAGIVIPDPFAATAAGEGEDLDEDEAE